MQILRPCVVILALAAVAFMPTQAQEPSLQPSVSPVEIEKLSAVRPNVDSWGLYGSGETHALAKDTTVPGGFSLRVQVEAASPHPWDIGVHADLAKNLQRGDQVYLVFWARPEKSPEDAQTIHLTASLTGNDAPYPQIGDAALEIRGPEWRTYCVSGTSPDDFAAYRAGASLQIATGHQTLDLGPILILVARTDTDRKAVSGGCPMLIDAVSKMPLAVKTEHVAFENPIAHVKLAAAFRAPQGKGPFPAVIFVSGHGPRTMSERSWLAVSDALNDRGIATLDYDKRGAGGSTGDYASADLTDLIADADAAVTYLKSRHDIQLNRIGLIGGSEGGMIAPAVAARDPSVAFVVLLAAPAVRMDKIAVRQTVSQMRAAGADERHITSIQDGYQKMIAAAIAAKSDEEAVASMYEAAAPLIAQNIVSRAQIDAAIKMLSERPTRLLFAYDPATVLREVNVPLLALNGSLDQQVSAGENLAAIREATANNPDVTIIEMPGLNHLFQDAKTGEMSEWRALHQPAHTGTGVLSTITEWIVKHTS